MGTLTKINIVNDIGEDIITSWETVMDHFWLYKIWNIHNDEQIATNKSLWLSCVFILIFKCQHDLFYIWSFFPLYNYLVVKAKAHLFWGFLKEILVKRKKIQYLETQSI